MLLSPSVSLAQAKIAGDHFSKAGALGALNGGSGPRHYRRIFSGGSELGTGPETCG